MRRQDDEPLNLTFAMASTHVLNGNRAKGPGTHGRFFGGRLKTDDDFLCYDKRVNATTQTCMSWRPVSCFLCDERYSTGLLEQVGRRRSHPARCRFHPQLT